METTIGLWKGKRGCYIGIMEKENGNSYRV